jgi:hypothetical protein
MLDYNYMQGMLSPTSDIEVVWDPTPDDFGIKRWDSFCFLQTWPWMPLFFKEYPYPPDVIQRYHDLQNEVARAVEGNQNALSNSSHFRILTLPIVEESERIPLNPDWSLCAVNIPYISGTLAHNSPLIAEITDRIRLIVPGIRIQKIQGANCRIQTDGTIIVTDIAWDIPTFLLDNPCGQWELDKFIASLQKRWSQIIYDAYPTVRD